MVDERVDLSDHSMAAGMAVKLVVEMADQMGHLEAVEKAATSVGVMVVLLALNKAASTVVLLVDATVVDSAGKLAAVLDPKKE